jgi:hypothetical protein
MNILKYNRINGPKKTVTDYLQTLTNDDLQSLYNSGAFYDLKLPDLMKKLQKELHKRNVNTQTALF